MSFMPAALFPVLKTFCKKPISIKITLTLHDLIPTKTAGPSSYYSRPPLILTVTFWILHRFSLTLFFISIKMNLNCLLLNSPDTISLHIPKNDGYTLYVALNRVSDGSCAQECTSCTFLGYEFAMRTRFCMEPLPSVAVLKYASLHILGLRVQALA